MPRCQNSEVTLDRSKGQIVMHFRSQHTGPNFPKSICEILACSLSAYFQRCISMIVVCAFVELHSCCPDQCSQFSLVIGMRLEIRAVDSGGGKWCPAPPFEIGAPPFHVWPPGCYIYPILYFKNVAPPAAKSWRRACLKT